VEGIFDIFVNYFIDMLVVVVVVVVVDFVVYLKLLNQLNLGILKYCLLNLFIVFTIFNLAFYHHYFINQSELVKNDLIYY